jgi:hypothetical protein
MCDVLFIRYTRIPISPTAFRIHRMVHVAKKNIIHTVPLCVSDTDTGQRIHFSSKNSLQVTKTFCEYILRHMCDERVTAPRLDTHTEAMLDVGICCSQHDRAIYTNFVGNFYFRTGNIALSVSKQPILQHTPVNVCTRQVLISIDYSVIYNC